MALVDCQVALALWVRPKLQRDARLLAFEPHRIRRRREDLEAGVRRPTLSGDSEKIEILVWPLVVALAYCLYAPELDIQ